MDYATHDDRFLPRLDQSGTCQKMEHFPHSLWTVLSMQTLLASFPKNVTSK